MAALAEGPGIALDLSGMALPATIRLATPLTDEEISAFSRRNKVYKIELNAQGELEIMSPVGTEGSHFEAVLVSALAGWAEEFGGIVFGTTGGFRLPDGSVRSPDGAWISSGRWDALSKAEQEGFAPICPDFLMELLSPSDSRPAMERKMQRWIANGARLAWMIDPYRATVSVYRADGSVEVLERPEEVEADAVVTGFRLLTGRFWVR